MASTAVHDIESQFAQLPPAAQLSVLERLVRQLRANLADRGAAAESDLAKMAADPDVQRELRQIAVEFAGTESGGL